MNHYKAEFDFEKDLNEQIEDIRAMLIGKNRRYGDSALNPVRIFSKADAIEQIKVRIDDKLSRLARGKKAGEDVVKDLLGYLFLLRIAEKRKALQTKASGASTWKTTDPNQPVLLSVRDWQVRAKQNVLEVLKNGKLIEIIKTDKATKRFKTKTEERLEEAAQAGKDLANFIRKEEGIEK